MLIFLFEALCGTLDISQVVPDPPGHNAFDQSSWKHGYLSSSTAGKAATALTLAFNVSGMEQAADPCVVPHPDHSSRECMFTWFLEAPLASLRMKGTLFYSQGGRWTN